MLKIQKKGFLGVDCSENRIIGCKIFIKKLVYWQADDIGQRMGVPPPLPGIIHKLKKFNEDFLIWSACLFQMLHFDPNPIKSILVADLWTMFF